MYENEINESDEESPIWDEFLNRPLEGELFIGVDIGDGDNDGDDDGDDGEHDNDDYQRENERGNGRDLIISEVNVHFPQKPYGSQMKMMKGIINALKEETNTLIESPTGSGKTLAILCGALAWRKQEHIRDSSKPLKKIFYCTRTHSQISSVLKELRKTDYAHGDSVPQLKVAVLGSRYQMCVNEEASIEGSKLDDLCDQWKRNFHSRKSGASTCQYYKLAGDDYFLNKGGEIEDILDIEDLQIVARDKKCCAYFGTRRQLPSSNFIICPYNYIVSSHIRRSLKIDLKNAILIFDEGHNLEKVLCSEGSMSLEETLFGEVQIKCYNLSKHKDASRNVQEASKRLFTVFQNVFNWLKEFQGNSASQYPYGNSVIQELKTKGLGNLSELKSDLSVASGIDIDVIDHGQVLDRTTSQTIQKVITVMEYLNGTEANDYFVNIAECNNGEAVKINVICINPGVVFREIANETSSIAITSGTLTPLASYAHELKVDFSEQHTLEQSIPRERYFASILTVGPLGALPKLTRNERRPAFTNLGEAIIEICHKVPNGVVVFFPSKEFIRAMMNDWQYSLSQVDGQEGTLIERLHEIKEVIDERHMDTPQKTRDLLRKYRESSKQSRGAVLLGVHRGKVSEGVDFRDHEARAVINIGIPYAPRKSAEVKARENHYVVNLNDRNLFWDWYTTDAFRAVNQGLGRSVRHFQDWGAIIMIDPRFSEDEKRYLLPKWISDATQVYNEPSSGFQTMLSKLCRFISRMESR